MRFKSNKKGEASGAQCTLGNLLGPGRHLVKTLFKVRKLVEYTKYDILSSRNAEKKKKCRKNGFLAPKTGLLAPEMGFKSII